MGVGLGGGAVFLAGFFDDVDDGGWGFEEFLELKAVQH